MKPHADKAEELFRQGYNCSQAAFGAFAEELRLDFDTAVRLASSFGGGMGRMREVCGAVSGILLAAGLLFGYSNPDSPQEKRDHYARVQELAGRFRQKNGSIICREILGSADSSPNPTARSEEFYTKRPCLRVIRDAVDILDDYIAVYNHNNNFTE